MLPALAILLAASTTARAADRDLLHRNGLRGIAYQSIAVAGAASSNAPLRAVLSRKIALDGDGTVNVRGNLYPIDVDGDGTWELLHFNGYRVMRVYRADGAKLWQVNNSKGRVHRDNVHRDTMAILDMDGDRSQDIVHCWSIPKSNRQVLIARDGRTGRVIRQVTLPGNAESECQIAAINVQGRTGPTIFVSAAAAPSAGCRGNYVDRWAKTLAFDTSFRKVWERTTCDSGHYLWPVGVDAGNRAKAVAIGKYIVDAQGRLLCKLGQFGHDHVDSMAVGDLDPASPGVEIVAVGVTGSYAYNVAPNGSCRLLWTKAPSRIPNPQLAIMAKLDTRQPGLSVAIRTEGSGGSKDGTYILDRGGHIVDFSPNRSFSPMQNANLDGAKGTDELVGAEGLVMGATGTVRLDDSWYKGLGALSAKEQKLSIYDQWTYRPVWFDLFDTGRDQLITWSRHAIVIGRIGL